MSGLRVTSMLQVIITSVSVVNDIPRDTYDIMFIIISEDSWFRRKRSRKIQCGHYYCVAMEIIVFLVLAPTTNEENIIRRSPRSTYNLIIGLCRMRVYGKDVVRRRGGHVFRVTWLVFKSAGLRTKLDSVLCVICVQATPAVTTTTTTTSDRPNRDV